MKNEYLEYPDFSKIEDLEEGSAERGFAEACYENNSISELMAATESDADETDCNTWGITAEEWGNAVVAALHARTHEAD